MGIKVQDLREGDRIGVMGAVRQVIWRDDIGKYSVWFASDGWYSFDPDHEFTAIWRNHRRMNSLPEDRPERRHPGARV